MDFGDLVLHFTVRRQKQKHIVSLSPIEWFDQEKEKSIFYNKDLTCISIIINYTF